MRIKKDIKHGTYKFRNIIDLDKRHETQQRKELKRIQKMKNKGIEESKVLPNAKSQESMAVDEKEEENEESNSLGKDEDIESVS